MAVELTNAQILSSLNALQQLANQPSLPVKMSFATIKNLRVLQEEATTINDFRQELLEDVAVWEDGQLQTELDEDGNETTKIKFVDDDAKQRYVDELNDRYNEAVELPLRQIDVENIGELELSPQVVFTLEWMFDDEA